MKIRDIEFKDGYATIPVTIPLTIKEEDLSIELLHLFAKSVHMDWAFNESSLDFTVGYLPEDKDHEEKMVFNKDGEVVDERGDLFEYLLRLVYCIVPNVEGRGRFD